MKNTITATLEFSFKGENFVLSTCLDLDELMQKYQSFPPLHQLLASQNKIDPYSYEYEMLLGEDIQFSEPKGSALSFFDHADFDQQGFEKYWINDNFLQKLSPMIKQQLSIVDIHQHTELKVVILAAYHAGIQAQKDLSS